MSNSDSHKNLRILVIDDNRAIHEDFRKILAANRSAPPLDSAEAILFDDAVPSRPTPEFALASAYQGREGLALVERARAEQLPYAVAFVDVRMPPGWDGIETSVKLWEADPDLQIVICTAYSDYSWSGMMEKLGHSDQLVVLKKPFDTVEVLQLATALTEKWRLQQEARRSINDLEDLVSTRTRDLQSAHDKLRLEINERKSIEEKLLQAQKMEAVGRLAGGVAHDFNNILTAISGFSELLLQRLPEAGPERGYASEIERASYRAARLTRQLLAFSRRQVLQPRVINLDTIVTETHKMLRRLIGENIKIRAVPGENLGRVKTDPGQLEQVIVNLAVNARDAMPQGGTLTLKTENVTIGPPEVARDPELTPGDYVMLAVSDTGVGMAREIKRHMFEPFFTTKSKDEGAGLGLSTCYGIIRQSGGHVTVESTVGRGTTFRVYLPRVADAAAESKAPGKEPAELIRGTESLLIVEDEPAVRDLATTILTEFGYQVISAGNGVDALAALCGCNEGRVDLVLTDVVMPQMGGKALADTLRVTHPALKVIFTSGYTEDAIVRQGVLEPGLTFIPKPYTSLALARKIRETLDNSRVSARLEESVL